MLVTEWDYDLEKEVIFASSSTLRKTSSSTVSVAITTSFGVRVLRRVLG
jgi:hypothetical protein